MTCEACLSGEPIYEAGCPGCEARAMDSLNKGVVMEWKPIETLPLEDVEFAPGHFDKWASDWVLLGRNDKHGWITWVGTYEANMWLERGADRSCGDCAKPTHWMPIPNPPSDPKESNADAS